MLDKDFNEILNKDTYLDNNIMDSCKEGVIDIKLKNKDGKYLFLSCKYYNIEKTLDKYGIIEMFSYLENIKIYNGNYDIGLIVKNKEEFMMKYKRSRKADIKAVLNTDYIFDYKDLEKFYNNFNNGDIMIIDSNKKNLTLKDYQKDLINKIDSNKNILLVKFIILLFWLTIHPVISFGTKEDTW
mgnify:CR=1 FL=1